MAIHRMIITSRLILEHFGQTLFLEQTSRNGGGLSFPGGKVERTEFAREGLVRETLEEIGAVIDIKQLDLVHVMHRNLSSATEVIFFFRASQWLGELRVREPAKFKAIRWVDNEVLPDELVAAMRHALKKYRKGKLFSEFPKEKL